MGGRELAKTKTPRSDLIASLTSEQIEYEYYFSACLVAGASDLAIERCGWLDSAIFSHEGLGELWERTKGGENPMDVATEMGLLLEITKKMSQSVSTIYPEEYARGISYAYYYKNMTAHALKLVSGVMNRDDDALRETIDAISESKPIITQEAYNSEQIDEEFREMMSTSSPAIMTKFKDLDAILGGLFRKELTILAARPGMGKTSLASQIAQQVAEYKNKVLFFSLEMSRVQLWARIACAQAGYSWREIRSGRAGQQAIDLVMQESKALPLKYGERLLIHDEVWSVSEMTGLVAKHRPDLVIIDHLGEIEWHERRVDELIWYGRATKQIRMHMARQLNTHVVLVHQLNRNVEQRKDRRPILADLRWSGELEQLADIVLMMYREDYYQEGNMSYMKSVPAEIWVRKYRQGPMNACAILDFELSSQRFSIPRPIGLILNKP